MAMLQTEFFFVWNCYPSIVWKVDKWCILLFWLHRKSKTMLLPVAKDKTGQRWEPGHHPLLEKQNGGTVKRIPYFHFELISNGEEREKIKCYPHYFTDSTPILGCRCASKVNQNFEQNIADDCQSVMSSELCAR